MLRLTLLYGLTLVLKKNHNAVPALSYRLTIQLTVYLNYKKQKLNFSSTDLAQAQIFQQFVQVEKH